MILLMMRENRITNGEKIFFLIVEAHLWIQFSVG